MPTPKFAPATVDDFDCLADIRIITMRPSLEALGRFNLERARTRFAGEYSPEHTTLVYYEAKLIGCYAVIPKDDQLYLGHFYILPEYQGQGIGKSLLTRAIEQADNEGKAMSLIVLNKSPAEAFYASAGFEITQQDDIETTMVRPARR